MDAALPAAFALGFVSGFSHAFEGDHVIAVSTLLHEKPKLSRALRTGLAWGAGHTTILMLGVVIVTALRLQVSPEQIALLELPVAVMLIALGLWTVAISIRRVKSLRTHTHDGIPHYHVGSHPHPHRFSTSWRGYSVGLVHGLAGSGALLLLVAATLPSALLGAAYALIFGLGSLIGMAVVTTALALPLLASQSRPYVFNSLTGFCGVLSVGLGMLIVGEVVLG